MLKHPWSVYPKQIQLRQARGTDKLKKKKMAMSADFCLLAKGWAFRAKYFDSQDFEVATTSIGKWYTGGRGFSLPARLTLSDSSDCVIKPSLKVFKEKEIDGKNYFGERATHTLDIAIRERPKEDDVPKQKRQKMEIKEDSSTSIQKPRITKPWSCNWCRLAFSSNHELKGHLLTHGEYERSFLCESCDQTFSKVQQLQQHRQIHASTKPFSCITCGKDLKSAKALDIHQVMKHTESEKIQCIECPRRVFRNDATLRVHLEGHKESKSST